MKILKLLKNNAVLCVAIVAAVITAFIVPPDEKYPGYFDLSTLYCLFGTLAVVEGLARIQKSSRGNVRARVYHLLRFDGHG